MFVRLYNLIPSSISTPEAQMGSARLKKLPEPPLGALDQHLDTLQLALGTCGFEHPPASAEARSANSAPPSAKCS
jgi:hypothetical protein